MIPLYIGTTASGHKVYVCRSDQLPITEMKWPGIWLVRAGTAAHKEAVKQLT